MCRTPLALAALLLLDGCSSTYHPDYHPETSYTYAQSVTYVKNAVYATRPAASGSASKGEVTSPGAVVVYGDFTGNIYLER